MDNSEIRAALNHHWEAAVSLDIDGAHDIYHDDVIVEFLQSGERISGKHNINELRKHYPAKLDFKILRMRGEGSLWVTEYIITYDGKRSVNVVNIMEFRDGKVARETLYFADPFEPPEWRSQWVERMV
ncbi:MAG: nuclear transport factor 2 family protein [Nitrososphaeraceae archaeon]